MEKTARLLESLRNEALHQRKAAKSHHTQAVRASNPVFHNNRAFVHAEIANALERIIKL